MCLNPPPHCVPETGSDMGSLSSYVIHHTAPGVSHFHTLSFLTPGKKESKPQNLLRNDACLDAVFPLTVEYMYRSNIAVYPVIIKSWHLLSGQCLCQAGALMWTKTARYSRRCPQLLWKRARDSFHTSSLDGVISPGLFHLSDYLSCS